MSNLQYLATTSILALVLSYGLHNYHGEGNVRSVDCTKYDKGKGMDENGKPFQVRDLYRCYLTLLLRTCPVSTLTTCVSILNPALSCFTS